VRSSAHSFYRDFEPCCRAGIRANLKLGERTAAALPHEGRGRSVTSRHSTLEIARQLGGDEAPRAQVAGTSPDAYESVRGRRIARADCGGGRKASVCIEWRKRKREGNQFARPQRWPRWGEGGILVINVNSGPGAEPQRSSGLASRDASSRSASSESREEANCIPPSAQGRVRAGTPARLKAVVYRSKRTRVLL
jgi:hypothetical protein